MFVLFCVGRLTWDDGNWNEYVSKTGWDDVENRM